MLGEQQDPPCVALGSLLSVYLTDICLPNHLTTCSTYSLHQRKLTEHSGTRPLSQRWSLMQENIINDTLSRPPWSAVVQVVEFMLCFCAPGCGQGLCTRWVFRLRNA